MSYRSVGSPPARSDFVSRRSWSAHDSPSTRCERGGQLATDVIPVRPKRRPQQPTNVLSDDDKWACLAYAAVKLGPEVPLVLVTLVCAPKTKRLTGHSTGYDACLTRSTADA